ncbi:MAG: N-acetylmuramoyl-L-alanine amidase [Bacteroidales bacterium]|nr:N-acetylmuramoyl-L-alanine amidase [Bacteroidales bacterium]
MNHVINIGYKDTFKNLKQTNICLKTAIIIIVSALFHAWPSIAAETQTSDFTVVIDAGHGGHDHGAIDNGAREKDINLGVATKLAELIKKKMKNVKVVMTRDNDKFISLQERANIANRNKGDLFISIHTNSVDKSNPNRKKISGTSVYALGNHKSNDNLRVARRENSVIELERDYHKKYSGFDPSKDESYIIFEMAQKKTIGQSLRFAEKAQRALVNSGRNDRGVRQAGFWVLWATTMPSVLVELDFICNPQAAAYMNSAKGQEELAASLFTAVEQYVKAQKQHADITTPVNEDSAGEVEKRLQKNTTAETYKNKESTIASRNDDNIGSLISKQSERKERVRTTTSNNRSNNPNAPRRRRSQAAREASASQNFETKEITQKSETSYLLRKEEPTEEVQAAPTDTDNSKDKKDKKKNKKNKKNKDKNNNNTNKKAKTSNSQKGNSKNNKKTFVVKNVENTVSKSSPTSNASSAANESVSTPLKRVYKVLLLTSPKELSKNDSQFQGIEPTGMFKENGMYKYTIGSSESRKEIENELLRIRSVIPEANIIVRME